MKQSAWACAALNILAILTCSAGNHAPPAGRTAAVVSEPAAIVDQKPESDAALIKPGRSVGVLHLGDTRDKLIKVLGEKLEEYTYDDPVKYSEMHWYDAEADRNGIFAYLKDGRVFQIESDTPRYRTAEGVTSDATPESVHSKYPDLQAYILLGSGSKVNGGRDLVYWVDRQRGIAFEFYYNSKAKKRRVSKTIVFEPGSEFQPEGHVSSPQELRKLKAFALEG
jgi:hypothetical protein